MYKLHVTTQVVYKNHSFNDRMTISHKKNFQTNVSIHIITFTLNGGGGCGW